MTDAQTLAWGQAKNGQWQHWTTPPFPPYKRLTKEQEKAIYIASLDVIIRLQETMRNETMQQRQLRWRGTSSGKKS